MIARLRGRLADKLPGEVLVDVGGVGYSAAISLQTFTVLPAAGSEVELLAVTVLRENALELFAFAEASERRAFQLLRSVSGIGPRMALSVLSGIAAADLARAVDGGDTARLVSIPGIGRKTAERIVIELRGKLDGAAPPPNSPAATRIDEDAVSALIGLGYKRAEAEKAVRATEAGTNGSLEELLRAALAALVRDVTVRG